MKVWAEKGSMEAMPGYRYISQSVSRSVNLSSPATMGTSPKVNLKIAQTDFTVSFEFVTSILIDFS
jgi:hypothetical protein